GGRSLGQWGGGAGGEGARHHHQHRARGVRDQEPPLRARRLPGARGLHQEHDHRGGADGRGDFGGGGLGRADAADARAHLAGAPGGGACDRGVHEQGGHGGRRGAARPGGAGGARAAVEVRVSGRRHSDHSRQRAQGARGRQGRARGAGDLEADGGGGQLHSASDARRGQAVFDAGGGRVLDRRARHGGPGAGGAGAGGGGRGGGDRR